MANSHCKNMLCAFAMACAIAVMPQGVMQKAHAAGEGEIVARDWGFRGPFGQFDRAALQRGLQVYREVCSACHGLKHVAFRNLAALGYNEAQIKAIAAEYEVVDGPDDEGEMFTRAGIPADRITGPFDNEAAARAANGGAYPPDLSLIIKARPDGANYLYSLLTGYEDAPADITVPEGMHFNRGFGGHMIAMAPPLSEGAVEYADGTEASVDAMAIDITTFLAWTAEPELEARNRIGLAVMIFLVVMCFVSYGGMRHVWRGVKGK